MRSNNKLPQVISDYCLGKKDDIAGSILKDYKDISYQTLWEEAQNNLSNLTGSNASKFKKELDNLQVKTQNKTVVELLQKEQEIEQAIIDVEKIADVEQSKTQNWFESVVKVFNGQKEATVNNNNQQITAIIDNIGGGEYDILRIGDDDMYAIKDDKLYEVHWSENKNKCYFGKKYNEGLLKRKLLNALREKLNDTQNRIVTQNRKINETKNKLFNFIRASYRGDDNDIAMIFKDNFDKDCNALESIVEKLKPKPKVKKKQLPSNLSLVFTQQEQEQPALGDRRRQLLEEIRDLLTAQEMSVEQVYTELLARKQENKAKKILDLYNNNLKPQLQRIKKGLEEFEKGDKASPDVNLYYRNYTSFKELVKKYGLLDLIEPESSEVKDSSLENNKTAPVAEKTTSDSEVSKQNVDMLLLDKNQTISGLRKEIEHKNSQIANIIKNRDDNLKLQTEKLKGELSAKDKNINDLQEQVKKFKNTIDNELNQDNSTRNVGVVSGGIGATTGTGAVIAGAAGGTVVALVFAVIALACILVCLVSVIANKKSVSAETTGPDKQIKSINHNTVVENGISLDNRNKQTMQLKNKDKYENSKNNRSNEIETTLIDKNNQIELQKNNHI